MKYLIHSILILLACTTISSVYGQSVSSRLDSTSFLIGDQTTLYVEAKTPGEAYEVDFLKVGLDTSSSIEVVRQSDLYRYVENEDVTFQRKFLVAFFDTGAFYIPPMPVVLKVGTQRDTLLTSAIPIRVFPPAVDSLQLEDIKPIIREPWKIVDAWPFLVATLLVGLLIFFIRRRRLRLSTQLEVEEVPKTPLELALQELDELQSRKLIESGETKEHFALLSIILRSYLERTFDFPAMELTTREIEYHLKNYLSDEHLKTNIRSQLERIDLIKYAKVAPDESEISSGLESIRDRVLQINSSVIGSVSEEEE